MKSSELYLEPGIFSERCTEKLPLRVDCIHNGSSERCPGIGFLSRGDREIGVLRNMEPPTRPRLECLRPFTYHCSWGLPEITPQISCIHLSPCLKVWFWGSPAQGTDPSLVAPHPSSRGHRIHEHTACSTWPKRGPLVASDPGAAPG